MYLICNLFIYGRIIRIIRVVGLELKYSNFVFKIWKRSNTNVAPLCISTIWKGTNESRSHACEESVVNIISSKLSLFSFGYFIVIYLFI